MRPLRESIFFPFSVFSVEFSAILVDGQKETAETDKWLDFGPSHVSFYALNEEASSMFPPLAGSEVRSIVRLLTRSKESVQGISSYSFWESECVPGYVTGVLNRLVELL